MEFSKDDADVATLIKLTEQCLAQRLYLNADNLNVPIMRKMLETVVGKVKGRLDTDGIDDPALAEHQARISKLLEDDLACNLHGKVKRLIRGYFADLGKEEAEKRAEEVGAPGGKDDAEGDGAGLGEDGEGEAKRERPGEETALA